MNAARGLVLLEHININVGDWAATERFYQGLGCQNAKVAIHMNCGPHTQFHMPLEEPVQVWRGEITVAYTAAGLVAVCQRLVVIGLGGAMAREGGVVHVCDPWGNRFRLREGSESEAAMAALPTKRPQTAETCAMGVIGIVEVSLPIQRGHSARLARFYGDVFGFETAVGDGEISIIGGPAPRSQRITFREQQDAPVQPYAGDHFAMYIGDFEGVFARCAERGILYVNPRFTWLDNSRTIEEARHWQAFRIMEAKDSSGHDGETMLTEEHEIRSLSHKFIPLSFESKY